MTQTLIFPKLGLTFNLDRVAFHLPGFLGNRPIYWYGIIIAVAFLAAMFYIMKRSNTFGLDADRVFEVAFVAIILGIIGARLYYVLFSDIDYWSNPADIFKIWEGGLAIYGGIIFGLLGIIITCKIRKVKLLPMLDLTVAAVLLGQAIGRWGNFINIEAFGSNTTMPWGMTGPSIVSYLQQNKTALEAIGMVIDPNQPVHPTFLYESVWCLIGFIAIALYTKRRRFDGELTLMYLAWYGFGRFFIEGLRTDSLLLGEIRISQLVALLCVVASIAFLVIAYRKLRKSDDPDFLRLYVTTEEAQLIIKGEFYNKDKSDEKEIEDSIEKLEDQETLDDTDSNVTENSEEIEEENKDI